MFSLAEKNAIVTGGASGIGLEISKLFAQQGAYVNIVDLNIEAAQNAVKQITNSGFKAKAFGCNVSKQIEVKSLVNEIIQQQRIDILINNAGVSHIGNAVNTSENDFDRLFQINVKGVYNFLHEVIPHMKDNGGVILNMSSVAANTGIQDRFAYSMTKGAVKLMTFSVARDFISNNIRCNCISPARVHTPFVDNFLKVNYPNNIDEMFDKLSKSQPIGRMGKPSEIANLALYLCSDEASFVTGSDFPIDGGFINLK
jgi:2-keto-3-deoxy-L-fuconate dehydrogenase